MSSLRAPSTDRFALTVLHNLKHDAPICATGPVELPAGVGAAFAAHEPHGLAVPVLHEVEIDAAREGKGDLREGEEPVAEVGSYFILLRWGREIIVMRTVICKGGDSRQGTYLRSERDSLPLVRTTKKVSPLFRAFKLRDFNCIRLQR